MVLGIYAFLAVPEGTEAAELAEALGDEGGLARQRALAAGYGSS